MDCIFCRIIAGEVEHSLVAADEHAVAFMDLGQINPGHVLIVPRRHATELVNLTADEAAGTIRLVLRVAQALQASDLRGEGYNIFQSNGPVAGQDVFHVHFHVVPRFANDPLHISIDSHRPRPTRPELDEYARRLAVHLPGMAQE